MIQDCQPFSGQAPRKYPRSKNKRFLKQVAELDTEDRNLLLWAFRQVRIKP